MKKLNEIGQIRSDWAHIENPDSGDRVLDSPGGFGQFFQKIGEKIKFEFSEKSRFSGFSGEIPKQTAGPHVLQFPVKGWDENGLPGSIKAGSKHFGSVQTASYGR